MTIRAASVEDAEVVATILIASRKRHVSFARLAHTETEIHDWVRETLIPNGDVWLMTNDQVAVGFISFSTSPEAAWIDQLYIHPDLTGHGYGTALLHYALQKLPSPIFLWTFQENHGARRFYERAGFIAVKFTDGLENEERCPDVLYRRS